MNILCNIEDKNTLEMMIGKYMDKIICIMKKVMLVFLFLLSLNLSPQTKKISNVYFNYQLTDLSKKILDMFIEDSMNLGRIDTLRCSIVFSLGDTHDINNELWIYDNELLASCIDHMYFTKYKGFNIFNSGSEIIQKYATKKKVNSTQKNICEKLFKSIPKEFQVPRIYDGCIFKIKRGTTIEKILIEKVQGG